MALNLGLLLERLGIKTPNLEGNWQLMVFYVKWLMSHKRLFVQFARIFLTGFMILMGQNGQSRIVGWRDTHMYEAEQQTIPKV